MREPNRKAIRKKACCKDCSGIGHERITQRRERRAFKDWLREVKKRG